MWRLLLLPASLLGSSLLGAVLVLGAPAVADELPPPAFPSGLPSPDSVGNDASVDDGYTPGPTLTITPSPGVVPGSPPAAGGSTPSPAGPGTDGGSTPGGTASSNPSPIPGTAAAPGASPESAPAGRATDDGSPVWVAVAALLVIGLILAAGAAGIVAGRAGRHARAA